MEKKTISKEVIVRLVLFALTWLNQIIAICASNTVYIAISVILTLGISGWNAWKNNDLTGFAITAGTVLKSLRDGKITEEEVNKIIVAGEAEAARALLNEAIKGNEALNEVIELNVESNIVNELNSVIDEAVAEPTEAINVSDINTNNEANQTTTEVVVENSEANTNNND